MLGGSCDDGSWVPVVAVPTILRATISFLRSPLHTRGTSSFVEMAAGLLVWNWSLGVVLVVAAVVGVVITAPVSSFPLARLGVRAPRDASRLLMGDWLLDFLGVWLLDFLGKITGMWSLSVSLPWGDPPNVGSLLCLGVVRASAILSICLGVRASSVGSLELFFLLLSVLSVGSFLFRVVLFLSAFVLCCTRFSEMGLTVVLMGVSGGGSRASPRTWLS